MESFTQPFANLSTANAELIARFAQSQEMAELANESAQKYFELAQKTFGAVAVGEARAELVRRLTEDYSTFACKHALSLIGDAAGGQTPLVRQVQAATSRLIEDAQARAHSCLEPNWTRPKLSDIPPEMQSRMKELAIGFEGRQYTFSGYRYDRLSDAINYAELSRSRDSLPSQR